MSAGYEAQDNLAEFRAKVEKEPMSSFLDMKLLELAPGHAKVPMKLRPEYLAFLQFVFGGIVMCVADQAFAFAVGSVGRPSVATLFNIHFVAAPSPEDELTAEGRILRKGRRVDIAEMTVAALCSSRSQIASICRQKSVHGAFWYEPQRTKATRSEGVG